MARPRAAFPAYCLHKGTGQAVVTIDGRDHYLGKHGSDDSKLAYERLILQWKQLGTTPSTRPRTASLTVRAMFAAYWRHVEAQGLYEKHGKATTERSCIAQAARPLVRLFGDTAAAEFGPLSLQIVRGAIAKPLRLPEDLQVPAGGEKPKRTRKRPEILARGTVNKHVHRIRRIFRWAESQELVPAGTWHTLRSVPALRRGAKDVRESAPVRAVTWADVEPTLAHLSPPLAAVVQLMWHTGARPSEALQLRMGDIDRSGPVWLYRPASHKTEHMGHERIVPIGPKAQAVLQPFLRADPAAYLFDPRDEAKARSKRRRAARKTPPWDSHMARLRDLATIGEDCNERYRIDGLGQAVTRACKAAKVAQRWTPNQLRHSAATRIRREFGLEAASVVLGHSNLQTTQIYAEADRLRAIEIAATVG
jgi:integrase